MRLILRQSLKLRPKLRSLLNIWTPNKKNSSATKYLFPPPKSPPCPIGHLGEAAPKVPHANNFTFLLTFLLFYTLHTQFLLLDMTKKVKRDREKVLLKADIKVENILKAVEAYQAPGSEFLMW